MKPTIDELVAERGVIFRKTRRQRAPPDRARCPGRCFRRPNAYATGQASYAGPATLFDTGFPHGVNQWISAADGLGFYCTSAYIFLLLGRPASRTTVVQLKWPPTWTEENWT